ncbi:MAG: ROK family protein [Gemmatimonadota bacterium]
MSLATRAGTLVGGLEAGGTKFVCGVGTGPGDVRCEARFPTTSPEETISRVIDFFREQRERHGPPAALGIGTFGPAVVDPASPTYGRIVSTPKSGWASVNLKGVIQEALDLPVAFDTDVNAAALGEWRWGVARELRTFVYLTVGTGIGGGIIANGGLLHGFLHPEMGHIPVPHDREADPFEGSCPFHGDCLEGLASGPAMQARWGSPPERLPPEHPAWELEARYLGLALWSYTNILSPQRIALGGGIMEQAHLFPRVRREVRNLSGGYALFPAVSKDSPGGEEPLDDYIVPPALGRRAGLLGAFALALKLVQER